MERIIKFLVEYDQKGRSLIEQAMEDRREMLAHMNDYKRELDEQYEKRSDNRVELYRQQAQAERDEQLAAVRAEYGARMERLRESFQQNSEGWIAQIVSRCIGG